jgi:hypothetical protein
MLWKFEQFLLWLTVVMVLPTQRCTLLNVSDRLHGYESSPPASNGSAGCCMPARTLQPPSLNLRWCDKDTDAGVRAVSCMSLLVPLDLCGCNKISTRQLGQ